MLYKVVLCLFVPLVLASSNERTSWMDGGRAKTFKLRVMTFNIWVCGSNVDNGLQKIAQEIVSSGADIVGLQVGKVCNVKKDCAHLSTFVTVNDDNESTRVNTICEGTLKRCAGSRRRTER